MTVKFEKIWSGGPRFQGYQISKIVTVCR